MILDGGTEGDILRLDLTVPNTGPGGGNNPTGALGKWVGVAWDDVDDAVFTVGKP